MTKKEMLAALENYPDNAVIVYNDAEYGFVEVQSVTDKLAGITVNRQNQSLSFQEIESWNKDLKWDGTVQVVVLSDVPAM